jgi:integrase
MPRGSIETLTTGFRARVYAGKDPITGKQTYLRGETRRNRRDAEADAERLLANVEGGRRPDQHATLSVLLDRWMEVVDHELTTRETNEGYIRRTLKPALGDMPLRKLQHRVDILDRLYTHLRRCGALCDGRSDRSHECKPMSPGAVRRLHAILSAALNLAVSWAWIERNPAQYAHPPKLSRRRPKPPDPALVAELINCAWLDDPELGLYLWLSVTTGARRGELVAVRWSSCDVQRGELLLDDNYVVRRGERRIKGTKTEDPRRLSLDSLSIQLLSDFRAVRASALHAGGVALEPDAFVFSPDPVGRRPWHPDHFTHAYRRLADPLGIESPLRNLRHFNATQLLTGGVDLRTVAGRLGHSDGGATTMRVYAQWVRPADQRAAELVAQELHGLREAARSSAGVPATFRPPSRARPIEAVLDRPGLADDAGAEASPYLRIAAAVRGAVAAGRLVPGDPVPSVAQLADWFSVSHGTAQRAVALLGVEGILVVRRGARTLVADRSA